MARQLRKQWPDSVIYAIGDPKHDIGRFSNTINKFYGAENENAVCAAIRIACLEFGCKPRAFFCSNPMLETIVGHYPQVFDYLEFENSYSIYDEVVDKRKAYLLCNRLGITVPQEYVLESTHPNEIEFPVVIKPRVKCSASSVSKCAIIKSLKDCSSYLQKLSMQDVDKSILLCQKFVEGDNRWEYGYGGYFDDGKPVVDICFHQFIQVPQGLCCFTHEVTDVNLEAKVKDLVRPFLDYSHFTGFLEFDIKQDSKSGQMYLLDINPRPWRSSDMLTAKLGDSTVFNPSPVNDKVVWRYPYRELFARKNSNNPPYSVCRSLVLNNNIITHIMLSDSLDKKPSRMQFKEDIKDLFKRIIK